MRIRYILLSLLAISALPAIGQSRYHPMQSEVPLRLPQDGNLFSHQQQPFAAEPTPAPSLNVAPATVSPEEPAPGTTLKRQTYRVPSPSELAKTPLAIGPSAVPATVAQQNEARLQAWQAQEDIRLEKQRQEQLALERERLKPQVLVVQQQDPWISNILAIPRFIGSLFGAK